jgi:RNA polymerase sigma-70 factor (ECF subfamily)
VQLLAADAVAYSDGGGKATAARVPIEGAERIAHFFVAIVKKAPAELELRGCARQRAPGRDDAARRARHQRAHARHPRRPHRVLLRHRDPDKLARVAT